MYGFFCVRVLLAMRESVAVPVPVSISALGQLRTCARPHTGRMIAYSYSSSHAYQSPTLSSAFRDTPTRTHPVGEYRGALFLTTDLPPLWKGYAVETHRAAVSPLRIDTTPLRNSADTHRRAHCSPSSPGVSTAAVHSVLRRGRKWMLKKHRRKRRHTSTNNLQARTAQFTARRSARLHQEYWTGQFLALALGQSVC
jgi:hypothetical protein